MDIKLIKTELELEQALSRMSALMNMNPDSASEIQDEVKLLGLVIKDYEDKHYPIPPSDPIEAIKFMMDQKGLRPVDMTQIFGTTSRYYEVINKKRPLTLEMLRKIHFMLGISCDILVGKPAEMKIKNTKGLKRFEHSRANRAVRSKRTPSLSQPKTLVTG